MKNRIFILLVIISVLSACSEEFLQLAPKSEGTSEITYKTDKDFNDAVIGAYREFQDVYMYFWYFSEIPGEDVRQDALRSQDIVRIDNFAVDVNDALIFNVWRDNYQVIERVNTILSKIEEVDVSAIANKDQYVGEAKFLRALAYFNLVRVFGKVPLVSAPVKIVDALKTPRTDVNTIYNTLIIPDLQDADAKLPETYSTSNVGRATKGAAKSVLGKVYLTTHDFVKAESKLKEVTTMGYSLLDNFEDLFDFSNEHNSEYIFDIEYVSGNIGLGSTFTRDFLVETQDVGAFRKILTASLNIQGPESGGRCTPSSDFINLFESGDLRQYRTATRGVYSPNGYIQEGEFMEIPQTAALKAITLKYAAPIVSDGYTNWRITRYADVLLMLAEAMNENSKTTEALSYLNQVRTRAGLSGYSGLSQSEARDNIYKERRIEMFMEGCGGRWFDLLRTGRAMQVCGPLGMNANETVFPIPQAEVEIVNDPAILGQNEGY